LIAPEDRQKALIFHQKLLTEGSAKGLEYTLIRKDGSRFISEVSTSAIRNGKGKADFFISVFRDVNKNKQEQKKRSAIYEISEAANSSKDLNELFAKVHTILKEFIPADNFYIALQDEKSKTLGFPYYVDKYDSPDKLSQYGPQKLSRGLTEYALRYGKPLLVTKEKFHKLLDKNEVEQLGTISLQWLGVPLKTYTEKNIGVLAVQIYDEENLEYTKDDEEFLAFVSTQVAMAIEHKRAAQVLQESQEAS
jgi:transcriptional regulator with GAF, ATPase, and Fis domain